MALKRAILDSRPSRRRTAPPSGLSRTPTTQPAQTHPLSSPRRQRFRSINGLERHLHNSGTRIIKVFLHISKEEQRKRLLDRIDTPQKNWKITPEDIKERHYWEQYQKAYEECLSATTTHEAAWHIVPADDKRNARLFVSQIILDALDSLDMSFPETTAERRRELGEMRKALVSSN